VIIKVPRTCSECGHDRRREYPRLDRGARGLWLVSLALLAMGIWRGAAGWVVGGVIAMLAVPLGRSMGGIYWWGGGRCTHCGHDSQYR